MTILGKQIDYYKIKENQYMVVEILPLEVMVEFEKEFIQTTKWTNLLIWQEIEQIIKEIIENYKKSCFTLLNARTKTGSYVKMRYQFLKRKNCSCSNLKLHDYSNDKSSATGCQGNGLKLQIDSVSLHVSVYPLKFRTCRLTLNTEFSLISNIKLVHEVDERLQKALGEVVTHTPKKNCSSTSLTANLEPNKSAGNLRSPSLENYGRKLLSSSNLCKYSEKEDENSSLKLKSCNASTTLYIKEGETKSESQQQNEDVQFKRSLFDKNINDDPPLHEEALYDVKKRKRKLKNSTEKNVKKDSKFKNRKLKTSTEKNVKNDSKLKNRKLKASSYFKKEVVSDFKSRDLMNYFKKNSSKKISNTSCSEEKTISALKSNFSYIGTYDYLPDLSLGIPAIEKASSESKIDSFSNKVESRKTEQLLENKITRKFSSKKDENSSLHENFCNDSLPDLLMDYSCEENSFESLYSFNNVADNHLKVNSFSKYNIELTENCSELGKKDALCTINKKDKNISVIDEIESSIGSLPDLMMSNLSDTSNHSLNSNSQNILDNSLRNREEVFEPKFSKQNKIKDSLTNISKLLESGHSSLQNIIYSDLKTKTDKKKNNHLTDVLVTNPVQRKYELKKSTDDPSKKIISPKKYKRTKTNDSSSSEPSIDCLNFKIKNYSKSNTLSDLSSPNCSPKNCKMKLAVYVSSPDLFKEDSDSELLEDDKKVNNLNTNKITNKSSHQKSQTHENHSQNDESDFDMGVPIIKSSNITFRALSKSKKYHERRTKYKIIDKMLPLQNYFNIERKEELTEIQNSIRPISRKENKHNHNISNAQVNSSKSPPSLQSTKVLATEKNINSTTKTELKEISSDKNMHGSRSNKGKCGLRTEIDKTRGFNVNSKQAQLSSGSENQSPHLNISSFQNSSESNISLGLTQLLDFGDDSFLEEKDQAEEMFLDSLMEIINKLTVKDFNTHLERNFKYLKQIVLGEVDNKSDEILVKGPKKTICNETYICVLDENLCDELSVMLNLRFKDIIEKSKRNLPVCYGIVVLLPELMKKILLSLPIVMERGISSDEEFDEIFFALSMKALKNDSLG